MHHVSYKVRLVVILLCCVASTAQNINTKTDANSLVTLSDYLRYAALNNAALKTSFEQWKASVEKVPQAEALPDPRFTYGYFIQEVETRVGPQQQRFSIMQTFPWFGKIQNQTDAASASAKASYKRYEAEKLKLFYNVKEAYYEYVYLAKSIEIAKENLELLKHFEEVARTKYTTQAATHPDIIRAQLELARIEDVLRSLEKLRDPVTAKLNAVLNRESDTILPWPEKPAFISAEMSRLEIIDILKKSNPDLAAMDYEVLAAKYRVELAKKNFWPDVGVGVDWIDTGPAAMSSMKDSGKDPVVLMFSINIPLWREKYAAQQRQAQAEQAAAEHKKTESLNMLVARIEKVLYDFEDSKRKINLYGGALVPKAEELLTASETSYQAGTVDFLNLIDAQRTLLHLMLQKERVEIDNQQRLAELEMLAGTELMTSKPPQK